MGGLNFLKDNGPDIIMNLKSKRKLIILILNVLVLTGLLIIRDNQVDRFIHQTSTNSDYNEVMLKATLMIHNKATYNWIAGIVVALCVLNLFAYRQWVQSKKWVLEPIIILVLTYGLAFSLYTLRTFEIKDQLIEENRIEKLRSTTPKANAVITPSEEDNWIEKEDLDSLKKHGMPH